MLKRKAITVLTMSVALSTAMGYSTSHINVYAESYDKEAVFLEQILEGIENATLILNQKSGSNDVTLVLEFSEDFDKSITSFEVLIQLDQSKIKNVSMDWNKKFAANHCRYTYNETTGELKLYVVDSKDLLDDRKITIGSMNIESDETTKFNSSLVLQELKTVDLQHNSDAVTVDRTAQTIEFTPSTKPTVTPTVTPIVTPTVTPTVAPTVTPTVAPTIAPTATPTPTPSKPSTSNPSTGSSGTTTPSIVTVQGIKLNKTKATLLIGKTVNLTATVAPTNASNKLVTWSSDNEKVAKVSKDGKVTAIGTGTATITVRSNDRPNIKATAVITVKEKTVKATRLKLSKASLVLKPKQSTTLKTTVLPTTVTDDSVVWWSSNPKVATVKNGKIVAKSVGTTTITAKTKDGSNIKATCKVTVSDIKLNKTKATLKIGNSLTLKATVTGNSQKVTWWSSNWKVASVSKTGKVTAKKAGTATITAKANGVTTTFKVTVK